MKVRICPLCDCEMKKSHYCDNCHSFVWKPEELDVHYNAQARGRGEEDCAYGDTHDAKHHGTGTKKKTTGSFQTQTYQNRKRTQASRTTSTSHQEVFGDMEKQKKKPKTGWIAKIIIIIIILNILSSGLTGIFSVISDSGFSDITDAIEEFVDDGGSSSGDSNYTDISDEEMASFTEACEGRNHFDLTYEELDLDSIIEAQGDFEVVNIEESTRNYYYSYSESEKTTYFESTATYRFSEDYRPYIEVNYDTVTGQIHEIYVTGFEADVTNAFMTSLGTKLATQIGTDEIQKNVNDLIGEADESYASVMLDNLYFYVTTNSDGTYWVDINVY